MLIGFLGGDCRMEIAAAYLEKCGVRTVLCRDATPPPLDLLVLPYPASRDGVTVAGTELPFTSLSIPPTLPLFGGRLPAAWREGRRTADAEDNEDFLCKNAYLTATAGVGTALRATERAFFRTDAAVLGFGRIGKATAAMLRALGADVCVYVRRASVRRLAEEEGFVSRLLEDTHTLPEALVFGTVPAPAENLAALCVKEGALVYDLGGGLPPFLPSGGKERVAVLSLRGAPGVFAPKAAGEIYGAAILDFLRKGI